MTKLNTSGSCKLQLHDTGQDHYHMHYMTLYWRITEFHPNFHTLASDNYSCTLEIVVQSQVGS